MVGIYKITSPSNKIYIGQSINIEKRFIGYKYSKAKKQPILHRSFMKYGIEKHKFEVVCECKKHELYTLEAYYQKLYSANSKNGLNCFVNSDKELDHLKYKKLREKYIEEERVNKFIEENKSNFLKSINLINEVI